MIEKKVEKEVKVICIKEDLDDELMIKLLVKKCMSNGIVFK